MGVPARITTSSQSMFDKLELSWLKESDTLFFDEYPLQTLQNMFRQGNSLRESLRYLQDQRKCDIDVYIFARSDTILLTLIVIPSSGIGDNKIWVPSWGGWMGIIDRLQLQDLLQQKFMLVGLKVTSKNFLLAGIVQRLCIHFITQKRCSGIGSIRTCLM